MLSSARFRWFVRCCAIERSLAVCIHHCIFRNNNKPVFNPPVHSFNHYDVRDPVVRALERGLRYIHYMSGSSIRCRGDDVSTAASAETSEDFNHTSQTLYSNGLEPYTDVPTIAGPLKESEKAALIYWKDKLSLTGHFYEAVFVLGPMCAGKTSTIHSFGCLKQYKHFAYVDTDEIMTHLDGYCDTDIDKFYPSARNVSIHLTDWLLEERMSFIAEGTCVKFLELRDYMIRLKDHGYSIKVVKLDTAPLDVLLERAEKRVRRRVSMDVIREIFVQSNIGLQKMWEINECEHLFEEFTLKSRTEPLLES